MPFSIRPLLLAGSCLFLATSAFAQAAPGTTQRMQAERAACDPSKQDVAACQREAGAARDEARRGNLAPAPNADANALARCDLQPAAQQAECRVRASGPSAAGISISGPGGTATSTQETNVSGSVKGGGVIRETTTTTVVQPEAKP